MYDSHKLCASENPDSSFPPCSASVPSQNSHPFTSHLLHLMQSSLLSLPRNKEIHQQSVTERLNNIYWEADEEYFVKYTQTKQLGIWLAIFLFWQYQAEWCG